MRDVYIFTVVVIPLIMMTLMGIARCAPDAEATKPTLPPYDRHEYMPNGWDDVDGDCQDTRTEVLIDQSLKTAITSMDDCHVISGLWVDPYTGEAHTDPSGLDVDHVVPLQHAHYAGGWKWHINHKMQFANDPRNLLVVGASANRSKGAQHPGEWLPPNLAFLAEYVTKYANIMALYELQYERDEEEAVRRLQGVMHDFEYRIRLDANDLYHLEQLTKK